ncbi:hypothetical protein [Caulobacter sp. X]|uniref:hypothetical protein n=1 Tax=Caulobacter sp. X TaxID=2048901 RepID=UPI000C1457E3|nr:hypothetical protein [Caulobacter sp. X]PIC00083.1 hypothetical protein CSW60_00455 [Caulobacter sp. X]
MTTPASSTDRDVERLCLALSAELIASGFLRGTFRSALDTILALAIAQANLAPMARNLAFQKTYAGLSSSPPDELRRPVRSRSIAISLGIPQETARRRVALMVESGFLVQTNAGVFMPKSVTETPVYIETAKATWRALGDLYIALRRSGALGPPAGGLGDGEPPHRYMMRLWGDHFLRLIETLLSMVQEPLGIVLLFTILRASQATESGAGRPVSALSLSRSLGMPFETVRRNALRLAENGLCQKASRGYLITAELLDTPIWRQFAERHRLILMRFFSIMGERDLLGWWEADYQAESR